MPEDSFVVEGLGGEKTLSGSITVGGAKNEALIAMAASVLFDDKMTLSNVPQIEDVKRMNELLTNLGGTVKQVDEKTYELDTTTFSETSLTTDIAKRMRASVVLTGPLLARFGSVTFPHPGGCVIGSRPIDIFLRGFKKMGARVNTTDEQYEISAPDGLHGAEIFFNVISVTATETLMLAATRASGTTVLRNAAMEPEVVALAEFLNACGARIHGVGTPVITIEGNGPLQANGQTHQIIPDRIEVGSFMVLGALSAKELSIENCEPMHVNMVTELLRTAGVPLEVNRTSIRIVNNTQPNKAFTAFDARTHEYPGLATDMQCPIVVFLTQASGESRVFETIFENRLGWTEDLVRMGADITMLNPQQILIKGPQPLRGRDMESPDLRAGLAFILAAAVGAGKSNIRNAYYIDRGYEHIERRLSDVGLKISRET